MCILNLLAGTRDCRPQSFPRWLVVALRNMGAAPICIFGTVGTVDDASCVPLPKTGKVPDEAAGLDRYPRLLCFRGYPWAGAAQGREPPPGIHASPLRREERVKDSFPSPPPL